MTRPHYVTQGQTSVHKLPDLMRGVFHAAAKLENLFNSDNCTFNVHVADQKEPRYDAMKTAFNLTGSKLNFAYHIIIGTLLRVKIYG